METTESILATLKDFQVDTVEYAFSRMWDEDDPTDRFLIADEVGLGKTMVAKGIVAKTVDLLRARGRRNINIVYVASNAQIARQNVSRLNAVGANDLQYADRLTLLPLVLSQLNENEVNFISLTPGTSLDTGTSLGRSDERALLHRLVTAHMGSRSVASHGWVELFRGNRDFYNFQWDVDRMGGASLIPALEARFSQALAHAKGPLGGTLETELIEVARRFGDAHRIHATRAGRVTPDRNLGRLRNLLVGTLRGLVASVSLDFLKPDLIVLDEFQRFKHLLDPETENPTPAQVLARELFDAPGAKLLLLSATPYKMFTLAGDPEGNEHYSDFLATVASLAGRERKRVVEDGLLAMRSGIYDVKGGDPGTGVPKLREGRAQVERELRRVMSRTERLGVTEDRNGMLTQKSLGEMKLRPEDVRGWVTLDKVRRFLDVPYDGFEYWRSAPYPLSMMNRDAYVVSRALHAAVTSHTSSNRTFRKLVREGEGLFPWGKVVKNEAVPPANAKMRVLMENILDKHQAWRIAWMPPSLPYYQPRGDYAIPEVQAFSKRLVFSTWGVVPKSIASMVSYEAERRCLENSSHPVRSYGTKTAPPFRLRLNATGSPMNLAAITLMYPSVSLARLGDPLQIARQLATENRAEKDSTSHLASPKEVLKVIEGRVAAKLSDLPIYRNRKRRGEVDNRWYSVVPFLLDQAEGFSSAPLGQLWWPTDEEDEGDDSDDSPTDRGTSATRQKELRAHLHALDHIAEMGLGCAPANLVEVVAMFALASPGVVLLRGLSRVGGEDSNRTVEDAEIRSLSFHLANRVRLLFNRQEVANLLRRTPQMPYWKAMLQMGVDGNLQAVIDEYFHTLVESEGLQDMPALHRARGITRAMEDAVSLRAMPNAINQFADNGWRVSLKSHNLSAHFAAVYGRQQTSEKTVVHEGQLRRAFNSPFRPFVLASTSVGQEGLDFHNYSHSVVHWNLPSNPVDLEQREGRVHRYKGHAVRKNVAADFRDAALQPEDAGGDADPWTAMFDAAERARAPELSDIVPYWVYAKEGGAAIERYVPAMPFSREQRQLTSLLRTVTEYRQVIGQPRQDDLLQFLSEGETNVAEYLGLNLEPPAHSSVTEATCATPSAGYDGGTQRRS